VYAADGAGRERQRAAGGPRYKSSLSGGFVKAAKTADTKIARIKKSAAGQRTKKKSA
jgi:hypothetical protein